MAACKVCGAPHVTCGPPSASLVAIPTYRKSEESNVALHEYHQNIRGIDTTVLLSDEDAERAGLTASDRVAHSTYVAPDPEADESDDAAGGDAVPQLTAEEVDTVRAFLAELKAARAEEGQNVDDGSADDQTGADSGDGEKQQDAPANKAARRPRNKAAASPAATE